MGHFKREFDVPQIIDYRRFHFIDSYLQASYSYFTEITRLQISYLNWKVRLLNRDDFVSSLSHYHRGRRRFFHVLCFITLAFTGSCTTTKPYNPLDDYKELSPATVINAPAPDPARAGNYDAEQVKRGKYMVELLGCPSCHTDGALVGAPVPGRPASRFRGFRQQRRSLPA